MRSYKQYKQCWFDGRIVNISSVRISALSDAVLFGYSLFDTLKLINGESLFIEEHMDRLMDQAKIVGLEMKLSVKLMAKILKSVYIANKRPDISVARISLLKNISRISLLVTLRYFDIPDSLYKKGVKVQFKQRTLSYAYISGLKTGNYLDNLLGRVDSSEKGFFETIFFDANGYITEGTACNIFVVDRNDNVITPALELGILNGITRQQVVKSLRDLNFNIYEGRILLSDLKNMKEVFITNSVYGVLRIAINGLVNSRVTDLLRQVYQ